MSLIIVKMRRMCKSLAPFLEIADAQLMAGRCVCQAESHRARADSQSRVQRNRRETRVVGHQGNDAWHQGRKPWPRQPGQGKKQRETLATEKSFLRTKPDTPSHIMKLMVHIIYSLQVI